MRHSPATDQLLFQTGSLSRMPQFCRELGQSHATVYAQIDPGLRGGFSRPALAPVRLAGELLHAGATLSGRADFGLQLGARHHPRDLGTLGYLLLAAPSTAVMTAAVERHGRFIQDGAFGVLVEARGLELHYASPIVDAAQRRQDVEFSVACMLSALRAAVGRRLAPVEVCFEHEAPVGATSHVAVFGCRVRFGQPGNRLVFDRTVPAMPLVGADAALFDGLDAYVSSGFGAALDGRELGRVVCRVIHSLLPLGEASLAAVAQRLDQSPRSLQRRLAADRGFGNLLDAARSELARHYVLGTRLSMAQIAQLLGYAESSVFTRSYQRWHRTTPRRDRRDDTAP
jgi:AraC-like DNA-binding protein